MSDEAALIERFRSGDAKAFAELASRYRHGLEKIARRYVKTEEEARDVSQTALLRAYEHRASFRGDSAFSSWLFRIGINAAISHSRSERAAPPEELSDDVAFTDSLGTTRLVAAELWQKIEKHLQELPPRQRLVVELRLFHDLSFEEIGAIVDSTEDAAKVNYHHAVKKLRSVLAAFMK